MDRDRDNATLLPYRVVLARTGHEVTRFRTRTEAESYCERARDFTTDPLRIDVWCGSLWAVATEGVA